MDHSSLGIRPEVVVVGVDSDVGIVVGEHRSGTPWDKEHTPGADYLEKLSLVPYLFHYHVTG